MRWRSFWPVLTLALAVGAGLGLVVLARSYSALVEVKGKSLFAQGEAMAALIGAAVSPDAGGGDLLPPERVAPIVRRLVPGPETRARIFDRDGTLILDTAGLGRRQSGFDAQRSDGALLRVLGWFTRGEPLPSRSVGMDGADAYPEVATAMTGSIPATQLLVENGEEIVSVAVPIHSRSTVQGVLLLTTRART